MKLKHIDSYDFAKASLEKGLMFKYGSEIAMVIGDKKSMEYIFIGSDFGDKLRIRVASGYPRVLENYVSVESFIERFKDKAPRLVRLIIFNADEFGGKC